MTLSTPGFARTMSTMLWWLSAASPAAATAIAWVLWYGSDRWWPATVLLYGPRWLLLLPLVALAVFAAWKRRRLLAPVALALWVVVGPVMGFRTGWRALGAESDLGLTLVTYNVRGGSLRFDVERLMDEWDADVAAFQECGALRFEILALEGWHTLGRTRACLVSRYPILETRVMERADLEAAGGAGLAVGYLLDGERGPFWLTNLHLATPRPGLEPIRSGRIGEGIELTRRVSRLRAEELSRAASFAAETPGPRVVVGDFNTPVESVAYRRSWRGWTNAFSFAGVGVGTTRRDGWAWARIDHVLVDSAWTVISARLGSDMGSDHLPLIVRISPL